MDDLFDLARKHLTNAKTADHGRSSHTFLHDGPLHQAVIAIAAGSALGEHNAPAASSLLVLHGRVRLVASAESVELSTGQVQAIPQERHSLEALEDAAVLLTTVTV